MPEVTSLPRGDAARARVLRLTTAPARFFGRTPGLDGVRALAVISVLVFHTAIFRPFAPMLLPSGDLGVDLFFALSGFLITTLLLREFADNGRIRLLAFYGRRLLRLYPALLVLLVASTIYWQVTGVDLGRQVGVVVSIAFYYSNWRSVWGPPAASSDLGHLWSLAVEEQFYLFWPPVLMALIALRTRVRVAAGLLLGAIVALVVHRVLLVHDGYPAVYLAVRTDTRVDVLLLGCVTAILWTHGLTPRRGVNAAATVALAFMLLAMRNAEGVYAEETARILFGIAACIAILAVVHGTWFALWFLELRPLRAIGRVSYGLYLWHLPVYQAVIRLKLGWGVWWQVGFALVVTVTATLVSWFLVEKTALRLKSRLEPRRPTRAEAEAKVAAEADVLANSDQPAAPKLTGSRAGGATPATPIHPPAEGTR